MSWTRDHQDGFLLGFISGCILGLLLTWAFGCQPTSRIDFTTKEPKSVSENSICVVATDGSLSNTYTDFQEGAISVRLLSAVHHNWLEPVVIQMRYRLTEKGNVLRTENVKLLGYHLDDPNGRHTWGIVIPGGDPNDPNHMKYRIEIMQMNVDICNLTTLSEAQYELKDSLADTTRQTCLEGE